MLSDPFSITINAVANPMARTSVVGNASTYMKADENLTMKVSHQKQNGGKRISSLVRVDQRIVAADVLTAENQFQTAGVRIIFDRPIVGFTSTQIQQLWAGVKAAMDDATVLKIYGQET